MADDFHTRFFYDTKPDYEGMDSFDSFDSACSCYSLDKVYIDVDRSVDGDGSCNETHIEQYLTEVEAGTLPHVSSDQTCSCGHCTGTTHETTVEQRAVPRELGTCTGKHCVEPLHDAPAERRAVPRKSTVELRAVPRALHFNIADSCGDDWSEMELDAYEHQFLPHPIEMECAGLNPAVNSTAHRGCPASSMVANRQVDIDQVGHTGSPESMSPSEYYHTGHENQINQGVGFRAYARTPHTFMHTAQDLAEAASSAFCVANFRNTFLVALCFAMHVACQAEQGAEDLKEPPKSTISLVSAVSRRAVPFMVILTCIPLAAIMCHMFPGNSNALRTPPSWSPELEGSYPFRQWARDIMLWSIATDMEPARKAASVMLVLKGAAKELSRQIPPQAVVEGGVVNGTPVDPLTFLMHTLQERFGNLGEEVRVQAVTELMSFSRKGNENIDALLVRFDSIRTRAAEQGGAIVSVQGVAWLLLRAVGISDQQLLHLLQPFGGLFPANEAELTQLKTSLRRMGHILEHAPGNIREGLRSQSSNASGSYLTHSEAYWTDQEAWPQSHIGLCGYSSPPGLAEARSPLMGDTPAGSSDPNAGNMQWASMAQMPPDLRELMPWPVLANTRATPEVPRFAMNPAFDFLQMSEQPPVPTRNPQQSTLEGPLRDQIEEFHYVQQQVAYQRQQVRNARPQTRPNVQVRSQLDPRHRPELGEFHQVQRTVARNSRRSRISERSINVEDVEYDGASDQCPLCQDLFLAKESVLRLVCKHLYHTECWSEWMCRGSALHCPVCRGNCHIIARYRIPEESASAPANIPSQLPSRAATPERADRQPDVYLLFTPPNRRTNAQESPDGTPFFSPEQHADTFPWWPSEEDSHAKAVYHSISIPNRAGIIIDPGAYTNLIGEHTARSFAKMAIEHGYTPRQWRMKPMFVQGVGEGQQKCEWTVSIPIACRLSVEGRVCCLNYFEAPVVGGSGARLPALLGLRSLSALSATLCMREGQESLFVPVAGNEASELSQQRRCPLDKAPSGHLIMTIDNWGELKHDAQAGVRPEPMVLHVDPSSSAAEESSIPAAI
ncbi:unnamed protein product [Durusdinium trenchii]|uniref:RING-type domain-containing protein n=1 Tax=Durusdinium trenchii TaxID=1381693 RepID=A0ABP0HDX6_9DINO